MGFFPCSPLTPGLAVHIDVLAFLRELHFTTAPNVSGFTKALENFLRTRYYKLANEVLVFSTNKFSLTYQHFSGFA